MKGPEGGSFGRSGGGRSTSVSAGPSFSRGGEGGRVGTMTMTRPSVGRIEGGIISQSIARPSNPLRMPTFSPVSRSVPEGPVRGFSFAKTKPFSVPSPAPEGSRPKVSLEKSIVRQPVSLEKTPKQTSNNPAEGLGRRVLASPTDVFSNLQPFVAPKDMSAENGGVQKNISAQGISRLANFDLQPKVSLEKTGEKRPTHTSSLKKGDVFLGAAVFAEAKRKKEKDANTNVAVQHSPALLNQRAEDQILAQRVREKLFATGVVGSIAEADRVVQKHLVEKYPEEKQVIIPREQQVLPQIKEQSVIDIKKVPDAVIVARLQAEIRQLAQQKTQDSAAVLQNLDVSKPLTINGLQVSLNQKTHPETKVQSETRVKQNRYTSEQAGAYMMLQKEKEDAKKEESKFTVDEVAQAARENLTRMTAIQTIWGKLYETINPKKAVTGAQVAAALPEQAPDDALSKLAKEFGLSDDGSYKEYRDMLGKVGSINSVSELMEQEKAIRAATPAVERVTQAKSEVGIKDVLRVLIGASDRYGFTK